MIRNFLFHRVNPQRDKLWDPMDVKLFDQCIQHISRNYQVELIEELVNSPDFYKKNHFATIMFDDGYKDNLEFAAPILDKHRVKASFYVVTDCIDQNIPTWTHILEHQFLHTQMRSIDLSAEFISSELTKGTFNTELDRIAFVQKLKPYLKKLSHSQRDWVLKRVAETFSDVEIPKIMMNWNEVNQLKSAGHYIGSHTCSHCMLGTMSDEAEISKELIQSRKRIEEQLGHAPLSISYPVGSYNQTTIELSKAAGYSLGLAVKQDIYKPQRDNLFEIPRIELYNESWWKTRLRISHTLEKIKSIIRYR